MNNEEISLLIGALGELRIRDRFFLKHDLSVISGKLAKKIDCSRDLERFKIKVEQASRRSLAKVADRLKISYPEELPITGRRCDILNAIENNPTVIICGDTGSGKTTQLPKLALEFGQGRFGMIGCTQPRRLAATAMAGRLSSELGCTLGNEVGYKVRFDDKTSQNTVIKFMTDGMLLAETSSDPQLLDYDTIIIDEVHERSLNIDFLLGYLKNLQVKRRDLKIIISSATLDTQRFSEFFDSAPVIKVEGRTFPVEDYFLPPDENEELSSHIARAVEFLDELDNSGDILVFLPGEREIRDATDMLTGRNYKNTEILPLFARLTAGEQQRIFSPGRRRRIILATNVAETSVTIPRIHYVVDSGLARISRYNAGTGIQELQVEQISRSSARQRRGRCGRLSDGVCVYLYDEETFEKSPEYTDPEIRRTSLAGVILQMASLKLGRIEHFPFVDSPPVNLIREGRRALLDIGAIEESGKITPLGWKVAAMPLDPHLAKMMATAELLGVFNEVTVIAAFLSIADPRERPREKQQQADSAHAQWRDKESDFITILNLWNFLQWNITSKSALRKIATKNFLNYNRLVEWRNLATDLWESAKDEKWKTGGGLPGEFREIAPDAVHQSLLSGVPRNLGMFDSERGNYQGTGNRRFQLFPGSTLGKMKNPPKWVVTLALVETSRIFARMNAVIKPEFLEIVAPHMCTATYDQPEFEPDSGFVYARERLVSGGLMINSGRRVHYGKLKPAEARKIFIREALCVGRIKSRHPQIKAHLRELEDLKNLEDKLRRPETVIDNEAIYEELLLRLPLEIVSTKTLETFLNSNKLLPLSREISMQYQYNPVNFNDYPDKMNFSGETYSLQYTFDPDNPADGIAVNVPRHELNLISPAQLDYLVPGYLAEKIEFMLRRLPKSLRVVFAPMADAISGYMSELESDRIPTDLPLADTLSEYLCNKYGENFSSREFDNIEFPEHLQMKIAVLNNSGDITEYLKEIPHSHHAGSRVSGRLARKFSTQGGCTWPGGGVLPEQMPLPDNNEIIAYPALFCDATGVGRQLYLRRDEAEMRHIAGVITLFRINNGEQVGFVSKQVKFSNRARLGIFYHDTERLYKEDFKSLLVLRSLGGDLWSIRSEEEFKMAEQKAKMALGEVADNLVEEIELFAQWHEKTAEALEKYESRGKVSVADAENELNFLFRPGFLRSDKSLKNYLRYLRGLNIRLDRMNSSPAKDEAKLEQIEDLNHRFYVAAQSVEEISRHPRLLDFFLLLEELRLGQFSPEVRPKFKVSIDIVQQAWNNLRI